ncbi:hypothetical protein [Nakamurella sp.]|uniref:hypothetical protein n=1 Tax=Nakamurella sp. TaxID=1869182 RepID=UPI003B3B7774
MDRRLVGVALVVVALAAVMVVPALSGIRSVGTPVAVSLPVPPAVGDCVVRLPAVGTDQGQSPPQVSMDRLLLGSCAGAIAAEVVAFWPDESALVDAPRSRRAGPCYPPLAQYAGLTLDATSTGAAEPWLVEPVSWRPTLAYQAFLVVPTDLERRAGRAWSACAIAPSGGQDYRGSLNASFGIGALPAGFGSCWTPDASGRFGGPGDCAAPHTAQLVATGWTGPYGPSASADIVASCRRVAARVMETADPARGGQLTFVADRMGGLASRWSGNPSTLGCFVVSADGRPLTGLVTGIGDRPLPFAS